MSLRDDLEALLAREEHAGTLLADYINVIIGVLDASEAALADAEVVEALEAAKQRASKRAVLDGVAADRLPAWLKSRSTS